MMTGVGVAAARDGWRSTMGIAAAPLLVALFLTGLAAGRGAAQESARLTLEEAIRTAVRNNPEFLQRSNDREPANWRVREAWSSLLPSVTANGSAAYTEAGIQRIGTLDFGAQSTDWYSSAYSLNMNVQVDGRTLFGIGSARANAASTAAAVLAEEFNLEQRVTLQYMVALRGRDAVQVARDQMERAAQNLDIVSTRVEAGAAAGTERLQAEVTLGRAEVVLLTAERDYRAARLGLMEVMGIQISPDFELVNEFEIVEPTWKAEALIADAMARHPSLSSLRASRSASDAQVRQAWSGYLPSLSLNASFQGNALQALNEEFITSSVRSQFEGQFSNCETFNAINAGIAGGIPNYSPQDCSQFLFSGVDGQAALQRNLSRNDVFPFNFTRQPATFSLRVSIPLFQGFSRQRELEEARASASDAAHALRAEELRLRTAITQALDDLRAAYRSVEIETRNLELARQQLTQARQRYAVGNTSILALQDAVTSLSTAEQDYLDARYTFHQSLVVLEAASGRSLRTDAAPARVDGDG